MSHTIHPALRRKACERVRHALRDYSMLEPGERVLVGVSGRDSLALAWLLQEAGPGLELLPVHVEPGFSPDAPAVEPLRRTLEGWGLPLELVSTQIAAGLATSGKRPCFACSRRRREILLRLAQERGVRTLALGHTEDDLVETLLLNLLFCRETSTMRPSQPLFDGRFRLVRPMCYLGRRDVARLVSALKIPRIPHDCPHGPKSERQRVRDFLRTLSREHPGAAHNAFLAMTRVRPDFLPVPPGYLDAAPRADEASEPRDALRQDEPAAPDDRRRPYGAA